MAVRKQSLIAFAVTTLIAGFALFMFAAPGEAQAEVDQTPYADVTVPARIEAEHFDNGAAGAAYRDTDGPFGNFRSDGVDETSAVDVWTIDNAGASGALIGRTRDAEFVEYTIDVAEADTFEVRLAVASGADRPGLIEVADATAGRLVGIVQGGTDRWFDWRVRSAGTIDLDAGTHVLRLTWEGGGNVNFDWLEVLSTTPSDATCQSGPLQAENAAISGRFEVVASAEASEGFHVEVPHGSGGWWNGASDSWIEFCTGVERAGTYYVQAGLRSPSAADNSFYVSVDSSPVVDFVADVTGSSYGADIVNDRAAADPLRDGDSAEAAVNAVPWTLDAGDHHIRFYLRRDGAQLDWIRLVPLDDDEGAEDPIDERPAVTPAPAATPSIGEPPFVPTPTAQPLIGEPIEPLPFPTITATPQPPSVEPPSGPTPAPTASPQLPPFGPTPTPTPFIGEPPFPPTPIPTGDCRSQEDDGSILLANPLAIGGPQCLGRIGDGPHAETTGDFDVWEIATDGVEGTIQIDARSFDPDRPVYARVVDAAGTSVVQSEFGGYVLADGRYYVVVGSEGTFLNNPFDSGSGDGAIDSGTYEIFAAWSGPLCESAEDDGSWPTANPVSFFTTCVGRIGDGPHAQSSGDVDVWHLGSGWAENPIYIEIFTSGEAPVSVRLVNEAGDLVVALNDILDFGVLDTEVPDDGDYYIVIAADGNELADLEDSASGNGALGAASYQMLVAVLPTEAPSPAPCFSQEDDGDVPSSNYLEPGFPCGGVVGDGPRAETTGDFDVWSLDPFAEDVPHTVAIDLVGVEADVDGSVYDTEGNLIASFTSGGVVELDLDRAAVLVIGPVGQTLGDLFDPDSGSGPGSGELINYELFVTAQRTPVALPRPNDGCDSVEDDGSVEGALVVDVAEFESRTCYGVIGDGPDPDRGDHDFFMVPDVSTGETLTFDIDARDLGSTLDSYLVVYDMNLEVAWRNDDALGSLDSLAEFMAEEPGNYFVGVGACCQFLEDPLDAQSGGSPTSTGEYLLTIERSDREPRDINFFDEPPSIAPEPIGPIPFPTPTPTPTPTIPNLAPTPTFPVPTSTPAPPPPLPAD